MIDEVLDPDKVEDEWDWDQLEDALMEQFNLEFEVKPARPTRRRRRSGRKVEDEARQSARRSCRARG